MNGKTALSRRKALAFSFALRYISFINVQSREETYVIF